jgi:predicted metalloprotease
MFNEPNYSLILLLGWYNHLGFKSLNRLYIEGVVMRWRDGRRSSNIDDRRASSGRGGRMPSMGTMMMLWPMIRPLLRTKLGWVIIGIGVFAYMSGYNPLAMVGIGGGAGTSIDEKQDNMRAAFISQVLADTEDVWNSTLPRYGERYREPTVVLYRGSTQSGCGYASAQIGPFYCPADEKVYLDLGFFDELSQQHNAPGDFAQAYVLAHEVGHHIQHLQGTLSRVHQAKQRWGSSDKRSNVLQVKVELQADCYAGVWAYHAHKRFNILESGDVEEALQAASAIGDDTLQRKATGHVRPDAFTHGSSKQRVEWFRKGLESGEMEQCNTFEVL